MTVVGERSVLVSGIGKSKVARRQTRTPMALTLDACLAAIADAGLTPTDIDGVSTYPGVSPGSPDWRTGYAGPGAQDIADALHIKVNWWNGGFETPGQLGAVINACAAVAMGLCHHVLVYRSVHESSAQSGAGRAAVLRGVAEAREGHALRVADEQQWRLPFGAASAANWLAGNLRRHMHEFGTTREQVAQIALNDRANASRNEQAVFRTPLTMADYLSAPMVSDPISLYDCDVPVDAAVAVVVSSDQTRSDLRKPSLRIHAIGSAAHGRHSWDQLDDLTTMACRDAATMMWQRSDLRPADIEVAELYDGFSFLAMLWLEALGFCGKGESGAFIDGGHRIGLEGQLPINTDGGQLSGGRMHGFGYLHEACTQLWGEGGERQVRKPSLPRAAVAAAGGGVNAGCLLIVRD